MGNINIINERFHFIVLLILLKMNTLKYTVIKSMEQYGNYCNLLQALSETHVDSRKHQDEIELLTLLIEKWDSEHSTLNESDPVQLIRFLMKENNLKAKDLTIILNISKGLVSDILNYKKGLSKDVIRLLAKYFKVSQEAFNRPYKLKTNIKTHVLNG